jgi:tRNA(Ile)-lysidine synthetase-like protein
LQRRVIQLQLLKLGFALDFDTTENLRLNPECRINAVVMDPAISSAAPNCLCRDLSGEIRVSKSSDGKYRLNSREVRLSGISGEILFDKVRIQWRKKRAKSENLLRALPQCEYFDADKTGGAVLLRHWAPGDRFKPIGMQMLIKLQDFFINEKIFYERRRSLIVAVAENGEIFWVEGLRISESFKVSHSTKRILCWKWNRKKESDLLSA